ncbi:MAG: hypothetical protein JO134_19895 [Xanthobacteraceae bacterium]|nr:hypothetical protein [Xanthobacteraceae bacterium]
MPILDELAERVVADRLDIWRSPFGEIDLGGLASEGDWCRHQGGGREQRDEGH